MAPRVLAENDLAADLPDIGRIDDLVGGPIGEDSVLVDPRLVREGVATDYGLVVLHLISGEPRTSRMCGPIPRS